MASWEEVQVGVRARFQLDQDDEDAFALTVPLATPRPRAQRVQVHRFEAWGRGMIAIRSAFGEAGDDGTASIRTLLEESLRLPLGGIALDGRFLVVVHKAFLDHLAVDAVIVLLTRVAAQADALESRGGRDRF